jgi:hypothetical protein
MSCSLLLQLQLLTAWLSAPMRRLRRTQQCFAVKKGADGFLEIARESFCKTTQQIHDLVGRYCDDYNRQDLKVLLPPAVPACTTEVGLPVRAASAPPPPSRAGALLADAPVLHCNQHEAGSAQRGGPRRQLQGAQSPARWAGAPRLRRDSSACAEQEAPSACPQVSSC